VKQSHHHAARLEEIERYAAGQHVMNARNAAETLKGANHLERSVHVKAWRAIREQLDKAIARAERHCHDPQEVHELIREGSVIPLTRS
jgi:hypothetical protein